MSIKTQNNLKRIYGDIAPRNRNIVLALAFTESSLDYSVKHKKDVAKGICGVVPKFHKDKLDDLGIDINSLKACEVIYTDYLEQYKGNKVKALVAYKGIEDKANIYLVYRVLDIENKINQK